MITNVEGLTRYLVKWLQDQAKASGTVNGCVGLSGGIDSAVVYALCARSFPRTVGVLMPCHSSPESVSRSQEVVLSQVDLGYKYCSSITIPLEAAFLSVYSVVTLEGDADLKFLGGSLRSCLRAPVLDYVAKANNSLVYGTGNRDEDALFRYYQKRGDGAVDNNVIIGLHKSEVRQLAVYLGLPQSVIDAVPSADLWGTGEVQTDEAELGVTYEEIEWITRMDAAHGILADRGSTDDYCYGDKVTGLAVWNAENEETQHFTPRQLEIIEKAYRAEKITRHKALPPPGPSRDDVAYFVI